MRAAPPAGVIGYNFTSPTSHDFSGLCVTAANPTVPPVGTPEVIQWALDEMACFITYNMATAAGTQGCSGCGGAPPAISLWNPSALDTDAWIAAGVAMGASVRCIRCEHACVRAVCGMVCDVCVTRSRCAVYVMWRLGSVRAHPCSCDLLRRLQAVRVCGKGASPCGS